VARVAETIHAERALLLGWGSAILLQFAHPLVARGVADHSGFRQGLTAPWRRLRRTLDAMLALTFGGEAGAARAARAINAVHDRVHGPGYSAHDPALLIWVHATCLHAFMAAFERYVRPLTAAERDAYCAESAAVEPLLGIPVGSLPRSQAALRAYLGTMLAGHEIVVTDTARGLAHELLNPPGLRWLGPVAWLYRVAAMAFLPAAIREAYGFRWAARDRAAERAVAAVVRAALPLLPSPVRHWSAARAARRAHQARAESVAKPVL
jgi:uncharacterized protein (DUF2236 family)